MPDKIRTLSPNEGTFWESQVDGSDHEPLVTLFMVNVLESTEGISCPLVSPVGRLELLKGSAMRTINDIIAPTNSIFCLFIVPRLLCVKGYKRDSANRVFQKDSNAGAQLDQE